MCFFRASEFLFLFDSFTVVRICRRDHAHARNIVRSVEPIYVETNAYPLLFRLQFGLNNLFISLPLEGDRDPVPGLQGFQDFRQVFKAAEGS